MRRVEYVPLDRGGKTLELNTLTYFKGGVSHPHKLACALACCAAAGPDVVQGRAGGKDVQHAKTLGDDSRGHLLL